MKSRKLTMNIGIISFMVVFVILCFMTFAILSLVSARSNVNTIQKSIDHNAQYYELSSEGEKTLKTIDDYLYTQYQNTSSSQEYFNKVRQITQIVNNSQLDGHILSYDIQNNNQQLHIEIEILYPGKYFYKIKTWKVSPSQNWNMDQSMEIL